MCSHQPTSLTACGVQDGVADDQDEESERETSLLQIELETMKAVEQTQMLQQVSGCSIKVLMQRALLPAAAPQKTG